MPKKANPLGTDFRKIQPKLRMIADGSQEVNEARADFASAIRVTRQVSEESPVESLHALMEAKEVPRVTRSAPLPPSIEASVFIRRTGSVDRHDAASRRMDKGVAGRMQGKNPSRGSLSTASVRLTELARIAEDPSVEGIELGEPLKAPNPIVSSQRVGSPTRSLRSLGGTGKNVLIGIVDVQGFDFSHKDFLDRNGTRFIRIWDQGGASRPSPEKFGYGAEIRKSHMDQAIQSASREGLPAHLLEPQSQRRTGSHGTHVASIAAGNRGICPKAFLAGVLISLPEEDNDRRRSFYDSTRLAHAIDYLFDVAEELREEFDLDDLPVAINVSLGTNGHAHDGSSAVSRWIDSAVSVPGRCVCVATGNAGQEAPETADDLGFILGRIHSSGRIAARGLNAHLGWVVVGNGIEDISENEMEIWYSPADRFSVSVRPPGLDWTKPVEPGQFIENRQLEDGSFLSIYNDVYHPANGANYIAIYLSPFFSDDALKGARAGLWQVRLHGDEIRDGRFHAWIERDDPRPLGRFGDRQVWQFPSFFAEDSNVDDSSISSLGCGSSVIAVANLDEPGEKINITSSQGPTRDGRFKPDVAAPGTEIVAANGFGAKSDPEWVAMSGTSMASPYVTGVVGLMLAREPHLTAPQIAGILQRTAQPLPGADFNWRNDAGYGAIDAAKALDEVKSVNERADRTKEEPS